MKKSKLEVEAQRLVMLSVKVPSVINFEEIIALKTFDYLKKQNKDLFDFLNLFIETDAKDFSTKISKYSKIFEKENLTLE